MKTEPRIIISRYVFVIFIAGVIAIGINGCAATNTKESTGQYIDDATITAKVKAKLVEDPVVSALRIGVETYQGVVQLSGFANSLAEIEQAKTLAKQTEGVRNVKNDIHLKR